MRAFRARDGVAVAELDAEERMVVARIVADVGLLLGEEVFGIAHIYASFNDTFVHVTDLSGKETITRITG